ncbi:hypothetical protein HPB48_000953 [Haemaphysalis longicornis]|uniref:Uncharacterized protein n=1 Tax=Haemaphysalis longicornis TaxID=44386 RepID=A0A9J6FZ72_HAELO|nr:hypothetical protein HPB48_000953 [Haemaphysalis longicornis]
MWTTQPGRSRSPGGERKEAVNHNPDRWPPGSTRRICQVLENEHKIVQLEQYSRCENIEIKGVPSIEGESLPAFLHKVGSALGEPVVETDINACHRVPTNDDTVSNIVVHFRSRSKLDIVLEKARKSRVSTTNLDFTHPSPVFLNEHLCPDLKRLLGMTVAKKKEKGWRYV